MSPRVSLSLISMLALSSLAAFVFVMEFQSFDQTHHSSLAAPGIVPANYPARPLSLRAYQDALMVCDRAMVAPIAAMQPENSRARTAAACADLARRALTQMPTFGLAHFVAAQAAFHRGDDRRAISHLEKSVKFARFEGWLAERRLALLIFRLPGKALSGSSTLKSDIATLLTTQSGAELLAGYFLRRPASRPIISDVAATARSSDQTRLANIIRKLQAKA